MTNVFHHLPRPRAFFAEAARCVRPGGVIAMFEPWVSPWSRLVYKYFHHEYFDPNARDWEFKTEGRLSGANGALVWIIFQRDRSQFEREFPQWQIQTIHPCMLFCYLLSGGGEYAKPHAWLVLPILALAGDLVTSTDGALGYVCWDRSRPPRR